MLVAHQEIGKRSRKNRHEKDKLTLGAAGLCFCLFAGFAMFTLLSHAMMGGLALAALFFFVWVASPFVGDVVQSAKEVMTREPTAEEKVDKLGTALGVRWQVIPERRRWVSHDAPDPEQESEQPVVRNLSETNIKED